MSKISARSWRLSRSVIFVFFSREKSTSAKPGPVIALRDRFPKLFVVFTKAHPATGPLAGHNVEVIQVTFAFVPTNPLCTRIGATTFGRTVAVPPFNPLKVETGFTTL